MRAVWLRVHAGLRQDWRSPLVLALITALMGALVLVSLAGARRTDTAVPRFLAWSGPTEGQVAGVPFATLGRIGRLPDVAYGERGAFMLILAAPAGRPAAGRPGQVTTWALIDTPPQARAIVVAGRRPSPARADEVMINESAARILGAHVGSVIALRGFRPDQVMQVLNNQVLHPTVTLPDVRVTAIIRTPSDLSDSGAPADVTFTGTGSLFLTAAFYHRFAGSVAGTSFRPAGLMPRNSSAIAIVFAVNCPPHAPAPGHATFSSSCTSALLIVPAAAAPTASKTSWIVTSRSRKRPGAIEPL